MNAIISIISAVIACVILVISAFLLSRLEVLLLIKSYNKRHKGQYDENTSPRKMSQRYSDWYVENFANMKEGSYDENE